MDWESTVFTGFFVCIYIIPCIIGGFVSAINFLSAFVNGIYEVNGFQKSLGAFYFLLLFDFLFIVIINVFDSSYNFFMRLLFFGITPYLFLVITTLLLFYIGKSFGWLFRQMSKDNRYENNLKDEYTTSLQLEDTSLNKNVNIRVYKDKVEYQDTIRKKRQHFLRYKKRLEWEELIQKCKEVDVEFADELEVFVEDFFVPDSVNQIKFKENLITLNESSYAMLNNDFGTKSIKDYECTILPIAFNKLFVAGFPDVYIWFQNKSSSNEKLDINAKLEMLTDFEIQSYFEKNETKQEFYRSIINQYLREGNILETSI